MAIVMKQQNRAEEAIEAIKSLRRRCSDQAQESMDNILLDLCKRCGRLDDEIGLLRHKLFLIQQGMAFNGKRTKTARSQGKKFQVSSFKFQSSKRPLGYCIFNGAYNVLLIDDCALQGLYAGTTVFVGLEMDRRPLFLNNILGNLGWALMQQNNYIEAEDAYRRALVIAPDNNKMCNLGICLMKQGRLGEAKDTLRLVKPAVVDGPRGVDSHLKASKPKPKMVLLMRMQISNPNIAANGNVLMGQVAKKTVMGPLVNSLNIDTRPFYVSNVVKSSVGNESVAEGLKRSRSGNAAAMVSEKETEVGNKARRKSGSPEKNSDWSELLPDSKDFEDAIIAAVLRGRSKRGSKCFKTSPRPLVQELDEFNITDFTYF